MLAGGDFAWGVEKGHRRTQAAYKVNSLFNSDDTYKVHQAVYRTLLNMVYYTGRRDLPNSQNLCLMSSQHLPRNQHCANIRINHAQDTSCAPAGW